MIWAKSNYISERQQSAPLWDWALAHFLFVMCKKHPYLELLLVIIPGLVK